MILKFVRTVTFPPGCNLAGSAAPPLWAFLLPSLEGLDIRPDGRIDEGLVESLRDWHVEGGTRRLWLLGAEGSLDQVRSEDAVYVTGDAAVSAAPLLGGPPLYRLTVSEGGGVARAETPARIGVQIPGGPARPTTASRGVQKVRRALARAAKRAGLGRGRGASAPSDDPSGVARSCEWIPADAAAQATLYLPEGVDPTRMPAWITQIAGNAGLETRDVAWQVIPARGYPSQKVMFLGRSRDGTRGLAVKLTQDPRFNPRLDNEHRGLTELATRANLPEGTAPRPLFVGRHRGHAVVGESSIEGRPFRALSDGTTSCLLYQQGLDWLDALARETARPASGGELAEALSAVVARFVEIYGDSALASRLRDDVDLVKRVPTLATVLLHGDPGPWNLLVADGRVAFLDWENAEPAGVPLWDLFYFLRTYGEFSAELAGHRATPRLAVRQLLDDSPLAAALDAELLRHLGRLGLPRGIVAPLFRLHLAYLAVREAWSLRSDRLERGRAFRLLRESIPRFDGGPVLWARETD